MRRFDYAEARSVQEAVDLLRDPRSRALAGGTDLLVRLRQRSWHADRVVNLKRIAELRGIRDEPDGLAIGALVTLDELARSDVVAARCPLLRDAARLMASPQVRSLATVGGNLCTASPAADLAPPLLCLDASVDVAGPAGRGTLPLRRFFRGPGRTALAEGEIVTGVRVPRLAARGVYLKFSPRRAMDLAIVSVACVATNSDTRVALGAVAPTPIVVPPSPDEAVALCQPVDDVRASAAYRRHLVRVLVRRALEAVQ